ncbi:MAG: hypothetical protein P4M09_02870 [Devosia sp.]|nr:hypothetical protein [Devosia sp.]
MLVRSAYRVLAVLRRLTDASGVLYRASTYEPFGAQVETVINALSAPERKGYIGERTLLGSEDNARSPSATAV